MKIIRRDWPRVRVRVKSSGTYYELDLRRKNYLGPKWKVFTDRSKALEEAAKIAEKVNEGGLNSISVADVTIAKRISFYRKRDTHLLAYRV